MMLGERRHYRVSSDLVSSTRIRAGADERELYFFSVKMCLCFGVGASKIVFKRMSDFSLSSRKPTHLAVLVVCAALIGVRQDIVRGADLRELLLGTSLVGVMLPVVVCHPKESGGGSVYACVREREAESLVLTKAQSRFIVDRREKKKKKNGAQ